MCRQDTEHQVQVVTRPTTAAVPQPPPGYIAGASVPVQGMAIPGMIPQVPQQQQQQQGNKGGGKGQGKAIREMRDSVNAVLGYIQQEQHTRAMQAAKDAADYEKKLQQEEREREQQKQDQRQDARDQKLFSVLESFAPQRKRAKHSSTMAAPVHQPSQSSMDLCNRLNAQAAMADSSSESESEDWSALAQTITPQVSKKAGASTTKKKQEVNPASLLNNPSFFSEDTLSKGDVKFLQSKASAPIKNVMKGLMAQRVSLSAMPADCIEDLVVEISKNKDFGNKGHWQGQYRQAVGKPSPQSATKADCIFRSLKATLEKAKGN